MNKFENRVVWITGASSGIGEGLAYEFARKKYKVLLSARNEQKLKLVQAGCGDNAEILPFDLMDYNNAGEYVKQAIEVFGTIDILINNGGISQRSLIKDTSLEVDEHLIKVDYLSVVALTKALLPHFIQKKSGHFVAITSLMGKFGSPYRSGYCGAKHAVHGFYDVLRMEHEKDNIDVTIVCPGFIATNVAINALTGDGSPQNVDDTATQNGMSVSDFSQKCLKVIERKKYEAYIGKKEVMGIYIKRLFPSLLHRLVLKSTFK